MDNASHDIESIFYLRDRTIYKRPLKREEKGKTIISIGFPICVVSKYCNPNEILELFNKHAD